MDENQCINLEEAVCAVHLGYNFFENTDADYLFEEIKSVIAGKNIKLYQRNKQGNEKEILME